MAFLRAAFLFVALAGSGGPALAADANASDWAAGLKSSARLIAGDSSQGRFHAGVEIKLAPGAITYWRSPGDAGLPPVLSFEGSQNLAQAHTLFPAPQRLNEGDGEAFGYDHSVIFPIDIEPIDPAKPVTVALKLDYAVCEKICVPAKADLRLSLPSGAEPSPYADAIARARALAPRPVEWADLAGKADLATLNDGLWRLCFAAPSGQPSLRRPVPFARRIADRDRELRHWAAA